MSQKAVREYDGKLMLSNWLKKHTDFVMDGFVQVEPLTSLEHLPDDHPWLKESKLVAKPDQLIKRRGKAGLIKLNASWEDASAWIAERRNKEVQVEVVKGVLDHFLVERFLPHEQEDEYYICIVGTREGDEVLFYHEGGVDVGDVDAKAVRMVAPVGQPVTEQQITEALLQKVPEARRPRLAQFISALLRFASELNYSYLEINPLVMTEDGKVTPLDMAAKIDETAKFECGGEWGKVEFPTPFGRPLLPEEEYINELDAKTGASLKLTILNPEGRVWTMVAGGGASVVYADTLADLGAGSELANYGEYSGAPSESMTFEYAKTVLSLLTKTKHSQGKVLIIGGGIANFTNVASTFKGIIRAITLFSEVLLAQNVKIYVRRGGPNYQQGLDLMRKLGVELSLPIEVYGPEAHMTSIVSRALGKPLFSSEPKHVPHVEEADSAGLLKRGAGQPKSNSGSGSNTPTSSKPSGSPVEKKENKLVGNDAAAPAADAGADTPKLPYELFNRHTRALIYGMQPQAVQNMLDFDFICGRETPSVAGMVYPFTASHYRKFYWNTQEILIPIYQDLAEAIAKSPKVDVVVNFSSFRSVFESTSDVLNYPQIRTIAIIAEGVPERRARALISRAGELGVTIIGPATVGGIKPGCFRIGNTGGMLDNIISSRLYRAGSVAYVARSGGMSNEMNNILARNSDGVYEGVAIGGDRYPGTTFIDHLLRYQADPKAKILLVLGEVGGVEEYKICEAIKNGVITKPVVAWCIGTCAKIFPYEVQFGHAGACANGQGETADAKNSALKAVGVSVPSSFEEFGVAINKVYTRLVEDGTIVVQPEGPSPSVPVDFDWARKLGLVRKPSAFVSSIVDERGEELVYAGMKISEVFKSNLGIGGVVGLIWFRKRLPDYFCRFIEMVLMVTADHGPAVSGAHNTIVCARAGKDLVSSLVSGLLTIGPRFGGALDGAAQKFSWAYDQAMAPQEFVKHMRNTKQLILGIGHKVKSLENPDMRVTIVKNFVKKHFKSTEVFDYACAVEQVTTKKKSNLILNVDGAIATAFVDLLRSCGAFTREEADEYVAMGALNGLFVLGRSIGFIGHYLDQNRLKQGLYRHPTDDISYLVDSNLTL